MNDPGSRNKFDAFAESYTNDMRDNLAFSGESYDYFLEYKVRCLEGLGLARESAILDYGCGIGNLTRVLAEHFHDVEGYDPSEKSLQVAARRVPRAKFHHTPSTVPAAHFQAVVLSGVLHHVPLRERLDLLLTVKQKLGRGGQLVVFEHNPLNPLTRKAVHTCPFDTDAVLIWPRALRRLIAEAGFEKVRLRYIVFFPRLLRALRPLEPYLGRCFAGAQTLTTGVNT